MSLAITGNGASALAVPLLVYAAGLSPHAAVCVAMLAVAATSSAGTLLASTSRNSTVRWHAAVPIAVGGVVSSPAGAWAASFIPGRWLLVGLSCLTLGVAARLVRGSQRCSSAPSRSKVRSPRGLFLVGASAGLLSGALGVGGGFVIVPALVLISQLAPHAAVTTALAAVSLISAAAASAHLFLGQRVPVMAATVFVTASLCGYFPGRLIAAKTSPRSAEKCLAIGLIATSLSMLYLTLFR